MWKATHELKAGDMVRNILDGKHYPVGVVEKGISGYIVTLHPGHVNGNRFFSEHHDYHNVLTED